MSLKLRDGEVIKIDGWNNVANIKTNEAGDFILTADHKLFYIGKWSRALDLLHDKVKSIYATFDSFMYITTDDQLYYCNCQYKVPFTCLYIQNNVACLNSEASQSFHGLGHTLEFTKLDSAIETYSDIQHQGDMVTTKFDHIQGNVCDIYGFRDKIKINLHGDMYNGSKIMASNVIWKYYFRYIYYVQKKKPM